MSAGVIFQVLGAALSIWDHKEKHKYLDKFLDLKRAYYAEYNKDPTRRSDAELDRLEFELRILSGAFVASVGEQNASLQQK
jgi:hypothetical protein